MRGRFLGICSYIERSFKKKKTREFYEGLMGSKVVSVHAIRACEWVDIKLHILNFDTICTEWSAALRRRFIPEEFNGNVVVPQSRSGPFGEEINLLPLMRIQSQFLRLTDHMLVIIRTAPNRLFLVKRRYNILSRYTAMEDTRPCE